MRISEDLRTQNRGATQIPSTTRVQAYLDASLGIILRTIAPTRLFVRKQWHGVGDLAP